MSSIDIFNKYGIEKGFEILDSHGTFEDFVEDKDWDWDELEMEMAQQTWDIYEALKAIKEIRNEHRSKRCIKMRK